MAITIDDIARELGTSVSTVSKALNGYADISEDTRQRVMAVAREMGYHPNAAARNLRRQRTDRIGLMINSSITYMIDYLAQVIPGAAYAAEREGRNLVLYTAGVDDPAEELTRVCRTREVDGLLLVWSELPEETISLLEKENIPFVIFGRRIENQNVSFVAPDNFRGARAMVRHLIEQGHRRIGFMTRTALGNTNVDRLAGYRQALEEAGIEFDLALLIETHIEPESGYHAMNTLLDLEQAPTAVFAFHDYLAVDAQRAASERGLRIPEDVAISGFDGLQITQMTSPPISTVSYPLFDMGRRAVEILLEKIQLVSRPPIQETIPVDLVLRASTLSIHVQQEIS